MRLFLLRHATAEATAPGGDADRALTPGGRDAFARHARSLAPELPVSRIVASPVRRARETAELLAGATGAPVAADAALRPGASSGRELLALAARLGAGTALVGHNPEIAEAVALAAGRGVEVRPGTVAAIDAEGGRFSLAWARAPGAG